MRKRRGFLFILVGIALALASGYMVLLIARQSAATAAAQVQPVQKVYVVAAAKDLPENVAISSGDVTTKEIPADFAPPGAIATTDVAIGKYTTTRVYSGEIIVTPLLAESKKSSALASLVPEGKVAMAVTIDDPLNSLGVLRPGDHVDILLTLDMSKLASTTLNPQTSTQSDNRSQLVSQLTMQDVEILSVGVPAGDVPTTTNGSSQTQPPPQQAKTITFLLDHQDAVTLKYVKDSGGVIDLVLRGPNDQDLAKTEAVGMDTIYKEFGFRFVQPVTR